VILPRKRYARARQARRNTKIEMKDGLHAPPPRPVVAPRPHLNQNCLPIGNEDSFKTLYLLSLALR
jgi:hypothetical protein